MPWRRLVIHLARTLRGETFGRSSLNQQLTEAIQCRGRLKVYRHLRAVVSTSRETTFSRKLCH